MVNPLRAELNLVFQYIEKTLEEVMYIEAVVDHNLQYEHELCIKKHLQC